MMKRVFQIPAIVLLIFLLVVSTGCSKAKDMMEEVEETSEELVEMSDQLNEAIEVVSEEVDKEESAIAESVDTEKEDVVEEYGELLYATFLIGDMGVYIAEATTFLENDLMGLTYQEGKGYLYIKGTIDNNGDEAKTLGQVLNLTGYDEAGKQIGNASSWIDSDGIFEMIEPKAQIEFDDLYMYNTDNSYITVEFEERGTDSEKAFFKVDIVEVSKESVQEAVQVNDEMNSILTLMSYDIIAAIDQNEFEDVMQYSQYSFIVPSLTSIVYEGVYFEGYNWENCAKDEAVYTWGVDSNDNIVEMTGNEFFDTYISDYNFLANEPEIVQGKIKYFPELLDSQATHYVKYTSGNNICYLIYEETYFNEFTLTGIAVGLN